MCFILTFDRPCNFVDLKKKQNRMHLCCKVNKIQQKCHSNCVGGMLKGTVTTECVGVKIIYTDEAFIPGTQSSKQRDKTFYCFWALLRQGARRSRVDMSKFRLANVESDPRTKKKLRL